MTGRTLAQGVSMESEGKLSDKYFQAVALLEMNPDDISRLGVVDRVKIIGKDGSVVLPVKANSNISNGTIFVPMGPWINFIMSSLTDGTGMPSLKSIKVFVEPTNEDVTSLNVILKSLGVKGLEYFPMDRPVKTGEKKVFENIPCPFCGDLCDNLRIEADGEKILRNIGGCAISIAKFLNYDKHRIMKPYIRKNGKLLEIDLNKAIDEVVEILVKAKYPLFYGWANTCNEAVELGVELAEITRGVIDNTSTVCHGPTIQGIQEIGSVRTTFGTVIQLADLIIFWGSNPSHAHLNHFTRLIMRTGKYVKGREDRKIVVIDVRKTPIAERSDLFIKIEPGRDLELLTALHMAIKNLEIEVPNVAGVSRDKILELSEMMTTAKYGVIFAGVGVTMSGAKHKFTQELIRFVQELNEWTKFAIIPMRGHYNVTGSNEVILWLTGYPYAVDFSRGFPKMIPGVTTAVDILSNGDVDTVFIVASDPVAHLPRKAVEHLSKIPVIVMDAKWSLTTLFADVVLPVGYVGIECEGSAYRMDGIPIRMKKVVDPAPGILSDFEILSIILSKLKEKKEVGA
ncbi:MAG: formylmethanofuran dehydrogenase subunit B [Candidatus Methanomethylicia archaeon]|nr:formylmethanofuran dehydrogenase subunit B [Candidatus Methanomethylicia archaeon]